ncbi:expressed unknown protein [Seminavis robusta]|uniref:Uncharacterized protein n=1 Tax=Seminavis robusta TaxID=568900 RepID=A0A9N8DDH7_9STRA|nr:expressed unknown protein [Seminavis robusta]|eukprot:Sro104_g052750.1 n/a (581) ;mRNA; f:34895-36637
MATSQEQTLPIVSSQQCFDDQEAKEEGAEGSHQRISASNHSISASVYSDSSYHDNMDEAMATQRSLQRFMNTLLYDAHVSALEVILIQDNASILTKEASLSARAAHERLAMDRRDHMIITKEISRWESYPFEVDKPIVVAKPKRAKNGCVPQRRAKRRSGLESAGEIKADILKKAESLPRRPRRRSSVATDEAQKSSVRQELMSLFDDDDDTTMSGNSSSTATGTSGSTVSSKTGSKLKRNISTPKKPTRRLSELPEDLTSINNNNNNSSGPISSSTNTRNSRPATILSDLMGDSMHSYESTETTLSEIASRQSDLSSISEQTNELLATLAEDRPMLDCSVILEEADSHHQQQQSILTTHLQNNGSQAGKKQQQSIPKKPVRRVSEVPHDLLGPMPRSSDGTSDVSTSSELTATQPLQPKIPEEEEELPSLTVMESPSVDLDHDPLSYDDEGDEGAKQQRNHPSMNSNGNNQIVNPRWSAEHRKVERTESLPNKKVSRTESLPKMPTRRVSEVPHNLVNSFAKGYHSPKRGLSPVRHGSDAQRSLSTESTASETSVASDIDEATAGRHPTELFAVILEEE